MGESIYGKGEFSAPVAPALSEWVLPEEEREELLAYDPDRARQLLADAGFPDGFATKFMVTPGYGPQVVRMAEWIVQDLAEVGIRAEIEIVDYATYFGARWPQLQYDLAVGPQTAFLEPDEWLYSQHHTDGPRNWFGISDPELDEMLEEQRRIPNGPEREELVDEIQRYIMRDLADPAYLWTQITTTLRQPEVRDYHPLASFGYGWLADTWLADS
jgi:peptide/nickel transport system substrate-binding protein